MIDLFGILVLLGGAIAVSSASLSKTQSTDRGWVLRMQRDIFDPGSVVPTDISHSTGTFAGRAVTLSLSSKVAGFGIRRRIVPLHLVARINCSCPNEFVLTKLNTEKQLPLRAASLKPVVVQRRDVIDAQGSGKPLAEQILDLQESGQLRTFASDVPSFRQWQITGDAAALLYELLYTHSVDSILLLNNQLEIRTVEPTSNAIESSSVRAMLQTTIALAEHLESHSPTR